MSLRAPGNNNPGRLDRRVMLLFRYTARDAVGGEVVTWIEAGSAWAGKLDSRGGRLYAAEAKHFETSLVYRIRHRVDVAEGWRLQHGDDVFEIVHAAEDGRRHFLDLFLRGVDVTSGSALSVRLLHGGSQPIRMLHDSSFALLHNAA